MAKLPDDSGDEPEDHQRKKHADEIRREPILALTFVQNDLHASQAQAEQSDPDVIDPESRLHARALHVRRVAHQKIRQQQRNDSHRHVDSSAPADKFPAICGSATFAMDVSSTSMNVASVTVTAITQGLIVPSGILSFARILFRISFESRPVVSTYSPPAPYL